MPASLPPERSTKAATLARRLLRLLAWVVTGLAVLLFLLLLALSQLKWATKPVENDEVASPAAADSVTSLPKPIEPVQ